MFPEYLKEREDLETLSDDRGFAAYRVIGEECYIKDIYIKPEARKSGAAGEIADKISVIAKSKGCKWLTGSVSPPAKGSHASLLVLVAYGMKLIRSEKDIIYFGKEI